MNKFIKEILIENNLSEFDIDRINKILNDDCKLCTMKTDLYYSQKIYEANQSNQE